MGWSGDSSEEGTMDGYEWICDLLKEFDSELLEFELDDEGQHFFEDMDQLLADHSHDTPCQAEIRISRFQATPYPRGFSTTEFQDVQTESSWEDAAPVASISFCTLLEEAQVAANTAEMRARSVRRPATTPRNRRGVGFRLRQLTTAAPQHRSPIQIVAKPKKQSSSRKKFNRRLF